MPLTGDGWAVRRLVLMTAGPVCQFRAQFCSARPSGSHLGGRRLGVPDELLGLAGRNRAIGAATGRRISSGAIGGPIGALIGDALNLLFSINA